MDLDVVYYVLSRILNFAYLMHNIIIDIDGQTSRVRWAARETVLKERHEHDLTRSV